MDRLPRLGLSPPLPIGACAVGLVALLGLVALPSTAYAQLATTATWQAPRNTLDGQLFLASPASLGTGLSTGVGLGYLRALGSNPSLAWGVRASWSTSTEYSLVDSVRDDDLRLRLCGLVQHLAGRGGFGLRLGLGATTVYEAHTRAQGARAGLSGSALETSNWYVFPAADLDAIVFLRIWNGWGMSLSGGPTLHLIDGAAHMGWSTGLGVAWQP